MLRVVLMAEGGAEARGPEPALVRPMDRLPEAALGPAHVLVRRALAHVRNVQPGDIFFERPLMVRGRIARGSDLLSRSTLRQLLTWLRPGTRPDLAGVLIDADGETTRRQTVSDHVQDLPVAKAIGMAVQEFEAWLIADHQAVGAVLGASPPTPKAPASMAPGEAKGLLKSWRAQFASDRQERDVRSALATECDLQRVAQRCQDFQLLMQALR